MIEFKPYESQPITRMAFQITDDLYVEKDHRVDSTYWIGFKEPEKDFEGISFKAYQEPKIGDWIVRLTKEDTYHVTDEVFRERNIIND
jgi:hypothetical protein